MNKKGVSQIIVTVLMILIVIAAVIIIWTVVQGFLKGSSDDLNFGIDNLLNRTDKTENEEEQNEKEPEPPTSKLQASIESVELQGTNLNIQVKRLEGEGEMTGADIILEDEDEKQETITIKQIQGIEETKTYTIDISTLSKIEKMSIKHIKAVPFETIDEQQINGQESSPFTIQNHIVNDDNLKIYLPFNRNRNDESGNNYQTTCYLRCPEQTENHEPYNQAYKFNSANLEGISIESNTNPDKIPIWTDSFTISLWVKQNPGRPRHGMIIFADKDVSPSENVRIFSSNSNLTSGPTRWHFDKTGGGIDEVMNIETDFTENQWEYLTVVYNHNEQKGYIYKNGELQSQGSGNMQINPTRAQISWYASDRYFNGALDEIRVYNKALTPEEINYLYKYN